MENCNKKQKKEPHYRLKKALLGQLVSFAGALAMCVVAAKGFIKEDDVLVYAGVIPGFLFAYSSHLYYQKAMNIFDEHESRNKLNKLERDLKN